MKHNYFFLLFPSLFILGCSHSPPQVQSDVSLIPEKKITTPSLKNVKEKSKNEFVSALGLTCRHGTSPKYQNKKTTLCLVNNKWKKVPQLN